MLVWVCFSCLKSIIYMRISTLISANWYVPVSVMSIFSVAGQTPSLAQVPSKSNISNALTCHLYQLTAEEVLNSRNSFLSSQPLEELYWCRHELNTSQYSWARAGFANTEKLRIVWLSLKTERVGCPRPRYYFVRIKRAFLSVQEISRL